MNKIAEAFAVTFAFLAAIAAFVASLVGIVLVHALVMTWACSTLWGWFVAPSTGIALPSAAWFGIAMIVGLFLRQKTRRLAEKKPTDAEKEKPIRTLLLDLAAVPIGVLATVGISWCVGSIAGWV